jgi:tetratricopeptide (TPR) repeat protein
VITEQEIEAAMHLSAERRFGDALALYRAMRGREQDLVTRMKSLFGIVTCSTWLGLDAIREDTIRDLKQLPDYDVSHAFIVMTQARAFIDCGRTQEALNLVTENLGSGVLQRADFQDWKYEHLFLKGQCLVRLNSIDEALCAFEAAHSMDAEGHLEPAMLIERANCYLARGRFTEAYELASQVQCCGDEEISTLAMQYMSECLLGQRRVEEALKLYRDLQKRLPCRLVDEARIETGIRNGIAYLEKRNPQGKPF